MRTKLTIPQKITRGLLILLLILVVGAAGFGGAAAVKYRQCAASPEKAVIEKTAALSEDHDVPIGRNIDISAEIRAPWGRTLTALDVQPGKGAQLAGTPSFERIKTGWGYVIWKIRAVMHAFRPGEIPAGTIGAVVEGGAEKKQELNLSLPSFSAKTLPVTDQDQLEIAGRITPPAEPENRTAKVIAAIAILVLLGAALWYFLRRRSMKRGVLPPWTVALQSIGGIKDDLHNGRANAASAITRLTDVIRGYLEIRFRLRAEHQTTREFLNEIQVGGPLEDKQRDFLKEFLVSADMVKFAKAPADVMAFDEAATRAETLVRETTVTEENGKDGAK